MLLRSLKGYRLLVVDDDFWTGATLNDAIRALREAAALCTRARANRGAARGTGSLSTAHSDAAAVTAHAAPQPSTEALPSELDTQIRTAGRVRARAARGPRGQP